eukprot:COSAG01_NODE_430_length_17153_cov_24.866717_16_plen_193_part_00
MTTQRPPLPLPHFTLTASPEPCASLVILLALACACMQESFEGAVQDLEVPSGKGGKLVVVGDTHGQLKDFLWILHTQGLPSSSNRSVCYLINGDVADRGDNAVEIFLLIFALKLLHPNAIFFNRGNHEMEEMNAREQDYGGGFMSEVRRKYSGRVFRLFQAIFNLFPIAAVVGGRVVVMHGAPARPPRVNNS